MARLLGYFLSGNVYICSFFFCLLLHAICITSLHVILADFLRRKNYSNMSKPIFSNNENYLPRLNKDCICL